MELGQVKGVSLKATDFNLKEEMQFNVQTGITTFRGSRLAIFDTNALGLLRHNVIESLGVKEAKRLFLRFGYQNGYSDHLQMRVNFEFDTEMDLLASGPVIHTWEGIVHAQPREISFDRKTGKFFFTGVWSNSYEGEQHLSFYEVGKEPVCWTLMGYASGWCTAFFGKPLIAIEPVCMGKGDDHCEWKIMPPADWGDEAKEYIEAYGDLLKGAE